MEFGTDPGKQTQWRALPKHYAITQAPERLIDAIEELRTFFERIPGDLA